MSAQPIDIQAVKKETERYKGAGLMWRVLALAQIPVTVVAIFSLIVMYLSADTVIQVPELPDAGVADVEALPNSEFVNAAVQFVNLVSTYQPHTARMQFETARKLLVEPALSQFDKETMEAELRTIEEAGRSQTFLAEVRQVDTERSDEKITVRIPGIIQQIVGQKGQAQLLTPQETVYYFEMTTAAEGSANPYGIVITNIRSRAVPLRVIAAEDKKRADEKRAAAWQESQKKKKKKKWKGVVKMDEKG